jgi:glycosyltransferase involved in cell wall biosynthesis
MCESSITPEMNQPLLHVIIPAFGRSPYLRQTLESAVKFLPVDLPITVIEDPSPDTNLESLVKEFPRVEYLRNSARLGIAGNFNESINKSRGLFTQICGSDDIFINDPTEKIFEELTNDLNVAIIGFDVSVIDKNNHEVWALPDFVKKILRPRIGKSKLFKNPKIFRNLMLGDWLYFPAIVWRTNLVREYKFAGDFHTAMDLDIVIRLLGDDKQIAFINEKILGYRRHDQSASSLYAKSIGRFDEEFRCHKNAIQVARNKNWKTGVILAQVALTVRLHAIMQSFLMVFSSPRSALKVLVKAISPIR